MFFGYGQPNSLLIGVPLPFRFIFQEKRTTPEGSPFYWNQFAEGV